LAGFNVADSSIVIGTALLLIHCFGRSNRQPALEMLPYLFTIFGFHLPTYGLW